MCGAKNAIAFEGMDTVIESMEPVNQGKLSSGAKNATAFEGMEIIIQKKQRLPD